MEHPHPINNEHLFKCFKQSILQNDIETFHAIKQRIANDSELKAYFRQQLQQDMNDEQGNVTPLYYAIVHQNYSIAKTLLNELNADPNEISSMQLQNFANVQSALSIAYFFSDKEASHSANLEQEESPLVLAAVLKNRDLVYLLISHGAEPLIYDATTRDQDILLKEAQKFVIEVRDEWIKAPLENTITQLKEELNLLNNSFENISDQSCFSPKPSI